jgi:hypothetical protein
VPPLLAPLLPEPPPDEAPLLPLLGFDPELPLALPELEPEPEPEPELDPPEPEPPDDPDPLEAPLLPKPDSSPLPPGDDEAAHALPSAAAARRSRPGSA